jgi:hypothetical protein
MNRPAGGSGYPLSHYVGKAEEPIIKNLKLNNSKNVEH